MTGRQHVPPDQYNRAEVSIRGLACPFAKSDPETYMSMNACRTTEGFKELRELRYVPRPQTAGPRGAKGSSHVSLGIWLTRLLQRAHMAKAHLVFPLRILPHSLEYLHVPQESKPEERGTLEDLRGKTLR